MWPYYMIVIYTTAIVLIFKAKHIRINNNKLMLIIVPLFVFAAFRGNGAGDYWAYLSYGESIDTFIAVFNNEFPMEMGYRTIAYIVNILHLPRQFVVIFMNMISLSLIYIFIKRHSSDWGLSVILFIPIFFQFDMHAARTAVAIAITTMGMQYIQERQLLKFIATIICACLFHKSAIITIVLYLIYRRRFKTYICVIVLFIETLFVKLVGVDRFFLAIFEYLGLADFYKIYAAYMGSEEFGYALSLIDPRIILVIFVVLVFKIFVCNPTEDEQFTTDALFLNAFFLILFSEHTFLAYRLSSYFYIYMLLVIPTLVKKFNFDKFVICSDKFLIKINAPFLYYSVVTLFTLLNLAYASTFESVDYQLFFFNGAGTEPY